MCVEGEGGEGQTLQPPPLPLLRFQSPLRCRTLTHDHAAANLNRFSPSRSPSHSCLHTNLFLNSPFLLLLLLLLLLLPAFFSIVPLLLFTITTNSTTSMIIVIVVVVSPQPPSP